MLMNKKCIQEICKQHDQYRTPSLNDILYLNFKGFTRIAELDEYVNVRALFLEGNILESLEGLPPLKKLRCLYVQQNLLTELSHLEQVDELDTLNASDNHLASLRGLEACPLLRTLIATNNRFASLDALRPLVQLKGLQTLDLQNCEISDAGVLELLKQLPELKCLYLKGNPVVSAIKNYRKTLVANIPTLTYLDDRPVFENERRCTDAWAKGGMEAERAERQRCKEEEEERNRKNHEYMQQLRTAGWRERRKILGLPDGDTDPLLDEMSDGEDYAFTQEPPELVEARQRLAAYTARVDEEEAPDVAEARRQLARKGGKVQEAHWSSAARDGEAYLADVRDNAQQQQVQQLQTLAGQHPQVQREHGQDADKDGACSEAEVGASDPSVFSASESPATSGGSSLNGRDPLPHDYINAEGVMARPSRSDAAASQHATAAEAAAPAATAEVLMAGSSAEAEPVSTWETAAGGPQEAAALGTQTPAPSSASSPALAHAADLPELELVGDIDLTELD